MFWNGLFSWLRGSCDDNVGSALDMLDDIGCSINPTTGLPMLSDCGGVDVGGSPFGMDVHLDDSGSSASIGILDDTWTSGSSNWDDVFSSSALGWDD